MNIITRSWAEAIALVDCDSFYVSCEVLLNPNLKDNPVCVLSNNDGCVVSRSKEAKALGIKMGESAFTAKKRAPNAIYLSSNYHHYGKVSTDIMNILREYTPDIEIYSIDEAFLNLRGIRQLYKKSYLEIAKDIRESVLRRTGIPVSIGVSVSKVLAKIATGLAKQEGGVYSISGKELREVLPKIPIKDIWQVGWNTQGLLQKHGVKTAYDFACQNEDWVKRVLTKKGLELQLEICGHSTWKVNPNEESIKGVQRTKSFAKCISEKEILKGAISYHLHRALTELRRKGLRAKRLSISLRRKDFQSESIGCIIDPPSNFEFDFTNKINDLFESLYISGTEYRSCGVYLTNFSSVNNEQLSLFSQKTSVEKKENLAKAWDLIENRFGKQALKTASMPSLEYLDKRLIRGVEKFSSFDHLPEVS